MTDVTKDSRYLWRLIKQFQRERDEARANARILAHSYKHDSDPPQRVVEESLAYPIGVAKEKVE